MVITKEFSLPTEEELTVEELNLGTPSLYAGAHHMGKYCEWLNNEYMLCKQEEKDKRKCLSEGKAVTACSLEFFRKVKKFCRDEFTQYANCLDKSSSKIDFTKCRNTQAVYDKCVLENLQIERPEIGYFCKARVHDSTRPKPLAPEPEEFPGAPPPLPLPKGEPPRGGRYGSRFFFYP